MKKFLALVCAVALVFEMVNMAHANIQIAAGENHTVGLKPDGTVVAAGSNNYGRCEVGSWTDISQIAAGRWHTVGLKSGGTVVAVGYNASGQCNVGSWILINQPPIDFQKNNFIIDIQTTVAQGFSPAFWQG